MVSVAEVDDQHVRLKLAARPEPYCLLLDETAAQNLGLEMYQHSLMMGLVGMDTSAKLLLTGDVLHLTLGPLQVVRVPNSKGKPLVVDQWGRTAP